MSESPRSPLPNQPREVSPSRRRGRPRKDGAEPDTRANIVSSAAFLFATRGYDNASLADIAAGAGATTGAIYAHFRGKPELLVEVIRETLAFLSFRGAEADAAQDPRSLLGYVRWLLHPDRRTTRQLINEVYTAAERVPEVFDMVRAYAETEAGAVAERIQRWQDAGRCNPDTDPVIAAHQFFIEVLGLCRVDAFAPDLLDDPAWQALVRRRVEQLVGVDGASAS